MVKVWRRLCLYSYPYYILWKLGDRYPTDDTFLAQIQTRRILQHNDASICYLVPAVTHRRFPRTRARNVPPNPTVGFEVSTQECRGTRDGVTDNYNRDT